MSADRFLKRLEQAGLLDEAVLSKLRKQIASAKTPYSARTLADALVKSGHLTKFQAAKLLQELGGDATASSTKPAGPPAPAPSKPKPAANDDDLGLAPLEDEEEGLLQQRPIAEEPSEAEDDEIVMLEDASGDRPVEELGLDLTDEDEAERAGAGLAAVEEDSGLEPVGEAGGLEPIEGLQPISPAGGLQPIGPAGGLEPIGPAGGLEPVSALEPIQAGAGLTPVDATGGLEPVQATGLEAIDDTQAAGLQPVGGTLQKGAPRVKKPRVRQNVWDSKLLYLGGVGLVAIILLGITLWYSLTRGTAAEMLQAADEDYRSAAYAQAIAKYEKFLKRFPKDPNVSLARVKISTGRMWQTVEGSSDKTRALETAKRELPLIENEAAFAQMRSELASILPDIADGFATQARNQEDMQRAQELVDLAEEAMQLVNNPSYIPTSQRKSIETKLASIDENIVLANRNINMSKRLAESVKQMREAAESGDTVQAFRIRHVLLNGERDDDGKVDVAGYPELRTAPELVEATKFITDRERELVKITDQAIAAETGDHPKPSLYPVALASRHTEKDAGNASHVISVLARGAIYGLKASDGELLWRRFVGHETLIPPQPVSLQSGADVIAVDSRRQELLCLESTTGALKWRLPLGEPCFAPVLQGRRALVALQSGKLLDVDLASGQSSRQIVLPMSVSVSPGTSQVRRLYQVGEHSNLYVLDDQDFQCREVYYLAHKPGTVAVPPVMVLGHLFVAVNTGRDFCELHVLKADENGQSLAPARDPLRLSGRVTTPLLVAGARVLVITDLGAIQILEVNPANEKEPVINAVAPVVASFQTPMDSFPVLDGGRLWVGNDRLTRFEIQTSRNQLASQWIEYQRDVFVAAPQVIGDSVYHLRRRKDSPAYTATASEAATGKTLWEVDLATPAALLNVDKEKSQVAAVTMQAELFEVTPDVFRAGKLDQAAASALGAARTVAFDRPIALSNDRWALAGDQDRGKIVLYKPQATSAAGRLEMRPLKPAAEAGVTASPVFFQDGLLVPLDNGQVALVDPETGQEKMLPLQAPTAGGVKTQWRRPAVTGDHFVLADKQGKLYRVTVNDTPEPHLETVTQADRGSEIASDLAAAGDTVYAVVREASSDTVISIAAADLAAGNEWPLDGRVVWGPETIGDWVLIATDRGKLLCLEAGQKQRWTIDLKYGSLAGRPLVHEGDLLLASISGTVWRVSGADGKEIAKNEIGNPLATGPEFFGAQGLLLLGGSDGTMHLIPALTAGGE